MSGSAPSLKPLVLLVDDLPANLHVLVSALKTDFRLKTATSGADALALLEQQDDLPKLVVLDVKMPGIGGIEVLRRMRASPATGDIPVILLSADSSEQNELAGLHLGADDYLVKPISPNVLSVRVHNQIQRHADRVQLRLAAHVFEYSGEAIMITDRHNRIIDVNAAFSALTGYDKADVLGMDPKMLSSGQAERELYEKMWAGIRDTGFWQGELWDRRKDGSVFPKMMTVSVVRDRTGVIEFHLANFVDISHLKEAHARIEHLAHHDPLTELPNRLHLQLYLEQSLMIAKRGGEQLAVMLLDLDRFKNINDTLGHSIGDQLLIQVAKRLKTSLREYDMVARLGGDEFVVVIRAAAIEDVASSVANKICHSLGQPFTIEKFTLRTASSIGIAVYPDNAEHMEDLMKSADTAMYHAKSEGGGNFQFFSPEMNRNAHEKMELENQLHEAIEKRQFELYFQPQLSLPDERLLGAEVLLRWRHPVKGLISPSVFIPLAEETNQIYKIGEWVLENACRRAGEWIAQGLPLKRIGINVSAKQFQNKGLYEAVKRALVLADISPQSLELELEITETAVMTSPVQAGEMLQSFREIGITVALDDFGQGYSSLGQLKNLPLDRLKIDAAFVQDISADVGERNNGAIASATIALAHNLGFKVIAEGVETSEHLAFLIAHGCDEAQGYYFAKPLSERDFEALLRRQQSED
ncbi:EAL domain-containing protein [Methylomonas sp. EFPC3]|uniref:EAL domain-containing response regulator n=1 Tax=Methylomonas sp. EFPC3 TaxID=3021710 RepID=UPI002416292B|nr:EAL domain-containing protein [Methylomonas sp. EFPC3]WFP51124.1 EAL domain-containing protein [Methylomonas sp. EFPC3]